jgi:hypothetical protein
MMLSATDIDMVAGSVGAGPDARRSGLRGRGGGFNLAITHEAVLHRFHHGELSWKPGDADDRARAWSRETYERLIAAKTYDPGTMLRFGHAIPLPGATPVEEW